MCGFLISSLIMAENFKLCYVLQQTSDCQPFVVTFEVSNDNILKTSLISNIPFLA